MMREDDLIDYTKNTFDVPTSSMVLNVFSNCSLSDEIYIDLLKWSLNCDRLSAGIAYDIPALLPFISYFRFSSHQVMDIIIAELTSRRHIFTDEISSQINLRRCLSSCLHFLFLKVCLAFDNCALISIEGTLLYWFIFLINAALLPYK